MLDFFSIQNKENFAEVQDASWPKKTCQVSILLQNSEAVVARKHTNVKNKHQQEAVACCVENEKYSYSAKKILLFTSKRQGEHKHMPWW